MYVSFYGADRHGVPGRHPNEFMDEHIEFTEDPAYDAISDRAVDLAKLWGMNVTAYDCESGQWILRTSC